MRLPQALRCVPHAHAPAVQAAIQANTYVVSGTAEEKTLDQMLPSIWNQLGASLGDPEMAKKLAAQLKAGAAGSAAAADDDVPELVENFECVAYSSCHVTAS